MERLRNSIQRVLDIAPEIQTAEAKVNAQQGALEQAGAWPNPTISVQSDDKLGIEDGSGGNDITQYAFSQPLPLSGRLSHQKAIASEALQGAIQSLSTGQTDTSLSNYIHSIT